MSTSVPRLLILGAHPDDAEFHAGGLAHAYRQHDYDVRMVSVTDGSAGHQTLRGTELAGIRRTEAAAAGAVIGAEYHAWDFPDGFLQPTLDVRERIIREIRSYQPDLVLTHRLNDYHPDHRAVGQAVQDACYLVTVPAVVPDVPALATDPVVALMTDLFSRPSPLIPDLVLDLAPHLEAVVSMLACQTSQVFDWLPYNQGILDQVPPADSPERIAWLTSWFSEIARQRNEPFAWAIEQAFGSTADQVQMVEVYEISEYAADLNAQDRERLFPDCHPVE